MELKQFLLFCTDQESLIGSLTNGISKPGQIFKQKKNSTAL